MGAMATQSPFSFLEGFLKGLPKPQPPAWAIEETHRRLVLLINHVLMQEPQAMERLVRQKGRTILAQWREFYFRLTVTPAGLFDLATTGQEPDLTLLVTQDSPLDLARGVLQGQKPSIRIEGDVQLAAEVNWLVDHVRWDLEEDLSKIVGDVAAHWMVQIARALAQALQQFPGARAFGNKSAGNA